MKVVVLAVWIGKDLPPWIDQFTARARAAKPLVTFKVVHLFNTTGVAGLLDQIERNIGIHPDVAGFSPRKVCDFRPAFGQIFPELIGAADWWGWCDLDVVLGDVTAFITPERLASYDLITDSGSIVNGPFTIMRNDDKMRTLYRRHAAWAKVLSSPEHVAFDEIHFTQTVNASPDVRPLFLKDVHGHENDRQGPPTLRDGKLFASDGRELLDYHFVRSGKHGRWPRILSST